MSPPEVRLRVGNNQAQEALKKVAEAVLNNSRIYSDPLGQMCLVNIGMYKRLVEGLHSACEREDNHVNQEELLSLFDVAVEGLLAAVGELTFVR